MLPRLICDDGSTARTATRRPASTHRTPSASISVLLPAPGDPLTAMRSVSSEVGRRESRSDANARCSGLRLSTSVMARESAARLPLARSSASVLESVCGRGMWSGQNGRRSSKADSFWKAVSLNSEAIRKGYSSSAASPSIGSSSSKAASEITVPGPKIAATPTSRRAAQSSGGITPPTITRMSGRP